MYKLRPYQEEAVQSTLQHFRKDRSPAVIVLPTGAGKSLVIAELAKIARGRVLVLAHVKELVEQNHSKYLSYNLEAGIYSAGLNRKDFTSKVIFGSIQSVARAEDSFFENFSLLIIDECHRVSEESETQYSQVISKLKNNAPDICILGLTATPYRLEDGWIYKFNYLGMMRTEQPKFFKKCIFDLSLKKMIDEGYLTPPIQIDAPVASYDFSSLKIKSTNGHFLLSDIEELLQDQRRVTPSIVENIVQISKNRKGIIIFTASVRHAEEILTYLPKGNSAIIIGDTPNEERDKLITEFKAQKIKYLVNVSVLTTGFDAPHVDLIAILRPTESVSLYQQIVGRGLRLSEGKVDCLVLDYTGVAHNIFSPQISDDKPTEDSVPVEVNCPMCEHVNDFWGIQSEEGEVIEHFGRKCRGAIQDPDSLEIIPCGFRYRYKICEDCGGENDIAARECFHCQRLLVDNDTKLKEAMGSKEAHVLRPDSMTFEKKIDKNGKERLEIRYYDFDAQFLSEIFYINDELEARAFYYNFVRMHNKLPEKNYEINTVSKALKVQNKFRIPIFIIARKHQNFWKIREKIFR
jgi:DNA repair protein RadD